MKPVIALSDIVTAFEDSAIGSKVTDHAGFLKLLTKAVGAHDFSKERVPGQALIPLDEAVQFVSSGVGPKSPDLSRYVLREHRGKVSSYLRRQFASPTESCSVVVYTREAYFKDPDVTHEESARIGPAATHVLVAVLASAGPRSPLTAYRFVWNLAGGNREAETWTADEIRAKAKEIIDYDNLWSSVADPIPVPCRRCSQTGYDGQSPDFECHRCRGKGFVPGP